MKILEKKRRSVPILILDLLLAALVLVSVAVATGYVWLDICSEKCLDMWLESRKHGEAATEELPFSESARTLQNPNRGFYHMHGFVISDEETDYRDNIAGRYAKDNHTALTLVEINLRNYREGDISEAGLKNLEALLEALAGVDKQWVLRFLYDWSGENAKWEPERLDIILRHMEQAGPVLEAYRDRIFVIQGLFIGNWGEMNGTEYLETQDLKALAGKLAEVTDEKIFLAVRMPAQWRKITGTADAGEAALGDGSLAARLGLFNDGMLGSWSDYGTYGDQTYAENGPFTYWNREEELSFQDELCRWVPIGGEVIADNAFNDFENAVRDLSAMHVTYISRDYDNKVHDKWAAAVYHGDDCYDGMDGLSYIETHLGYRLTLREASVQYDLDRDLLSVDVTIQNVGFAPVYREASARILLWNEERGELHSYELGGDVRKLPGGNEAEELLTLHGDIALDQELPGKLQIYFEIQDISSGQRILLANEQDPEAYGYEVGSLTLEPVETLTEEWKTQWRDRWKEDWKRENIPWLFGG